MEQEKTRLWAKVWNWAGREEDVPNHGDFFTFKIGRESFIVIRGDDDKVRTFFNVCPHRGNRLVAEGSGYLQEKISCPFHAWSFNFDGSIACVTDRETFRKEALARDMSLSEVRCEIWEGFVFINMDWDAKPLLDQLGPLPKHAMPYKLEQMRIVRRLTSTWDANWKVGFDGFAEAYHVHCIHPQILPVFNDYHSQIDLYPHGMTRAITKFGEESPRLENDEINLGLQGLDERSRD